MTSPPPLQEVRDDDGKKVEKVDNLLDTVGELTTSLTGQQRAALWLAAGVFGLVVAVMIVDFALLWWSLPANIAVPTTTAAPDLEAYKTLVTQHTAISNAVHERALNIFQTFVAASLLPVFTGIIGYIFGRDRARSDG